MNRPKISIIVPVYNAELYLNRCAHSIIGQSFSDWELILVDDGSPDSSGRLCDEIASQNPQHIIKVIHKSNGGVASARETGMANALGEYSIHIDPDDWIEPNTLQLLFHKAEEAGADVVICDFLLEYSSTHQEISCQSPEGIDSYLEAMLSQDRHGSLCNKLIRSDLYKKHNLHFPEDMICWEDLYICCNVFSNPIKTAYVGLPLYHYDLHSNEGSMTRMATTKTLQAMKMFCDYFDTKLEIDKRNWLNDSKALVKLTAYRCGLLNANEIHDIYPEVNQWFLRKYSKSYNMPMYQAMALVLSGKSCSYAKRFQTINTLYQRIISKLKRYV